jgi:hypothetical protein
MSRFWSRFDMNTTNDPSGVHPKGWLMLRSSVIRRGPVPWAFTTHTSKSPTREARITPSVQAKASYEPSGDQTGLVDPGLLDQWGGCEPSGFMSHRSFGASERSVAKAMAPPSGDQAGE